MVVRGLGDPLDQVLVGCEFTEPRPVVLDSVVAAVGGTHRHCDQFALAPCQRAFTVQASDRFLQAVGRVERCCVPDLGLRRLSYSSFQVYNTLEEVDALVDAVHYARKVFRLV